MQFCERKEKVSTKSFLASQLGSHPIFKRLQGLSDNQVFNKGREVADDIRERWETSDSAVVQRLQVKPNLPQGRAVHV